MYNFLKMHVGAFWTLRVALVLFAIAVVCLVAADFDGDKFSDYMLAAGGTIAAIDSIAFAGMALVMAMGI